MNLFFKFKSIFSRITFFGIVLVSLDSKAIDVVSLYSAPCQRDTGVILNVDAKTVTLLKIDGQIEKIRRYEIIYLAGYPVETVPIRNVVNPADSPFIHIKTRQAGQLVELLRGWPVDFTDDQISFLTIGGTGAIVDRNSIWSISEESTQQNLEFNDRKNISYTFVHPYPFSSCAIEPAAPRAFKVFPQQLLSDPVSIKRELDRLQAGHAQVSGYLKREQFYPVPQEYSNDSSLGLWSMIGARHGSSSHRANNFTPILIDQRSAGPFSYQQIIRTGSAPLLTGVHEETQTQAYFRFKADYLHFSVMGDPNLLLVGKRYKWSASDFKQNVVDGVVDETQLEVGFDYGPFELNLYPVDVVETGLRVDSGFDRAEVSLVRAGLTWQYYRWKADLQFGTGKKAAESNEWKLGSEELKLSILRLNFRYLFNEHFETQFSILNRKLVDGIHQYDSSSTAGSAVGTYKFNKKYSGAILLAVESVKTNYFSSGSSNSQSKIFPKGGFNGTLTF